MADATETPSPRAPTTRRLSAEAPALGALTAAWWAAVLIVDFRGDFPLNDDWGRRSGCRAWSVRPTSCGSVIGGMPHTDTSSERAASTRPRSEPRAGWPTTASKVSLAPQIHLPSSGSCSAREPASQSRISMRAAASKLSGRSSEPRSGAQRSASSSGPCTMRFRATKSARSPCSGCRAPAARIGARRASLRGALAAHQRKTRSASGPSKAPRNACGSWLEAVHSRRAASAPLAASIASAGRLALDSKRPLRQASCNARESSGERWS